MEDRVLHPVTYDVEIWDWRTRTYVADISNIVDGLSIDWKLNDVEDVSFSLDLIQFEKRCKAMGTTPDQVLTPYVHDLRIRRNGEYIIGCQVVETNIQIDNDTPPRIEVRCSGFLNLFKDSYLTMPWKGYTYSEIAEKLIIFGQKADCLIKNPTIDIDISYWLCPAGVQYFMENPTYIHSGAGSLAVSVPSGGTGWHGSGSRLFVPAGVPCKIDVWVSGQGGRPIYFRERSLVNVSDSQVDIGTITPPTDNTFVHFTGEWTTAFNKGYIYIEQDRTNAADLLIDDCFVFRTDDEDSLCNMNVTVGQNTTIGQSTREMKYDLQNIKDALIDLTTLEDDNFDFEFTPDRVFKCYDRKGLDKYDIEAVYPGNIHSMTISRSAVDLANKIYNIGSGIGDERVEYYATDTLSRQTYGTRESVITNSNVTIEDTLAAQANGELAVRKKPTNEPSIIIRDGSINPSNVQVGDGIVVKVDNDAYLGTINGMYRVLEMRLNVDENNVEEVTLTVEKEYSDES